MTITIANRYQLHETLGRGAMGVVHRATDRLTGDTIALKQITLTAEKLQFASRGTDDSTEALRIALATEFQTLAGLRHPRIISVLDYGFGRQRHAYFTMDYPPGAQTILEAVSDDFLRKPFREAEIFEVMAKHLGLKYVYEEEYIPYPKSEFLSMRHRQ